RLSALLRDGAAPADLVVLGLNHEQQHQELILTDLKHALACNPLRTAYRERAPEPCPPAGPLAWEEHPGALWEVGHAGPGSAYDNETPRHQVFLKPFLLAGRLVTSGEYQEFMADGGYDRPDLWLSDGWDARVRHDWTAPLYWERQGGRWCSLTLNGLHPVAEADPVCHVSYYEADAYARWAQAR